MKTVLGLPLSESRHGVYHRVLVALLPVGFFIAFTATGLGPFAPLLVLGGVYLVAFWVLLQLLFWLQVALRKVCPSWPGA
jgi:hypothetical protein